jgi:hypothetical protein
MLSLSAVSVEAIEAPTAIDHSIAVVRAISGINQVVSWTGVKPVTATVPPELVIAETSPKPIVPRPSFEAWAEEATTDQQVISRPSLHSREQVTTRSHPHLVGSIPAFPEQLARPMANCRGGVGGPAARSPQPQAGAVSDDDSVFDLPSVDRDVLASSYTAEEEQAAVVSKARQVEPASGSSSYRKEEC